MKKFLFVLLVILIGLFALGLVPKIFNKQQLKTMEAHTAGAVKKVQTATVTRAPSEETGFLPGNITAHQFAAIFARVDGYLKGRYVDIGDHVKAGQLLAEIDAPTIDADVLQAQADLVQARSQLCSAQANLKQAQAQEKSAEAQVCKAEADKAYSGITATRWQNMAQKGAVSVQSRDEKNRADQSQAAVLDSAKAQKLAADEAVAAARAQVGVAAAASAAKEASLKRYQAQQAFKYVRAPFDGVITLRKVDPGALITAGSQSQNLELFQLAKIDDLRIYINVPQTFARYATAGMSADVIVPEFPERKFTGKISNVSGGLDQQTRTRQTEVQIDNRDHTLLPGMYAQVHVVLERVQPWFKINSSAVVPRDNTTEVVVVENNKAHYRKITLGRDFGDSVEVKAGLTPSDVVVLSPPVDLMDGETVEPIAHKE